ncbi:hypothetical protein PROFUN_10001 [Planoprotostelium fungivorum]|uniref:NADAR domain-containing protein n=1 Tax=Planoprotostelium fungivorum TaxID=1890364 RepID=A0A2P6NFN8_9EUKA|nr:hypothetical protein PROFUN_10001 [Planoprotostelium fungivorum]
MAEPQYTFFWRPHEKHGVFGQWSDHPFTVDGNRFYTAENYMMYQKAMLFNDAKTAAKILASNDPRKVKGLGRAVANFDELAWEQHRLQIVIDGNMAKFQQNEDAKRALLSTGDRILVEASPLDRIWGIGFKKEDAMQHVEHWGLNLLGQALMETRSRLRQQVRD